MIRIRFDERDGRLRLAMEGHAGYAPAGQDTVCAAASMLGQTLALAVREQPGSRSRKASGRLEIVCDPTPEARAMFRMARAGFEALAEGYGAWVQVEEAAGAPGG